MCRDITQATDGLGRASMRVAAKTTVTELAHTARELTGGRSPSGNSLLSQRPRSWAWIVRVGAPCCPLLSTLTLPPSRTTLGACLRTIVGASGGYLFLQCRWGRPWPILILRIFSGAMDEPMVDILKIDTPPRRTQCCPQKSDQHCPWRAL